MSEASDDALGTENLWERPRLSRFVSLGFTGARRGMTPQQVMAFSDLLTSLPKPPVFFHHGDCVGSDADAHALVRSLSPRTRIVVHPPSSSRYRAFCDADILLDAGAYLTRNEHIVRDADVLLATPSGYEEIPRGSGTWATIRHARRVNKPHLIIWPDGEVE